MVSYCRTGTSTLFFIIMLSLILIPSIDNAQITSSYGTQTDVNLSSITPTLIWNYTIGKSVWSSPAVAKGIIYIGSLDTVFTDHQQIYTGDFYALNATDGKKIWSDPIAESFSSPAVADDIVYVGSYDHNVYALNATNGAELWSYKTNNAVETSPVIVNRIVYVSSNDGYLYALNASNGEKLWDSPLGTDLQYGTPTTLSGCSPAVANGVVYIAPSYYHINTIGVLSPGTIVGNVYALNTTSGEKIWSHSTGNFDSSPTVADSKVYIGIGSDVVALKSSNGTQTWSFRTGGSVGSSPTVLEDIVYAGSSDGNVYALNASNGVKMWSYSTSANVISSPAIAEDVTYVSSNDRNFYALNATSGTSLWKYSISNTSSPAIANNIVYIGSQDGNLYALNTSRPHSASTPASSLGNLFIIIGAGAIVAIIVSVIFLIGKKRLKPSLFSC